MTIGLGAKLDLIRRAKGLTIGETARICDIPERTMERILAGKNKPTAGHLFGILRGLRISLDAFVTEDFEEGE